MKAYKKIAQTLIEEIQAGTWSVGDLLPTERELMERFGVSRNTVREALRIVKDDGYIARRQGSRTVIVSTTKVGAFVNVVSSLDDLPLYIADTRSVHLATEHVLISERVAEIIGCSPNEKRLRVQYLRWRKESNEPLCYTEVYVEPEYDEVEQTLDGGTVYDKLESHFGITLSHVEQEIEATQADPNIASRLNIPVGSPVLAAKTMLYFPNNKLAQVSISHYPANRYRLRIRLTRAPLDRGTLQEIPNPSSPENLHTAVDKISAD